MPCHPASASGLGKFNKIDSPLARRDCRIRVPDRASRPLKQHFFARWLVAYSRAATCCNSLSMWLTSLWLSDLRVLAHVNFDGTGAWCLDTQTFGSLWIWPKWQLAGRSATFTVGRSIHSGVHDGISYFTWHTSGNLKVARPRERTSTDP